MSHIAARLLACLAVPGLVAGLARGVWVQGPRQHAAAPAARPRVGPPLTVVRANGMEPSAATLAGPAEEFGDAAAHAAFLAQQGALPRGFKVGVSSLTFTPVEEPGRTNLPMRLTLVVLDEPSDVWAAMFTSNAFPGSPVKVGRARMLAGGPLQAILINNKISNVCAGGLPGAGEDASEQLCDGVGSLLAAQAAASAKAAAAINGLSVGDANKAAAAAAIACAQTVLPCSTGIIGWSLPVADMLAALPACLASAQRDGLDAADAAKSIMTTDRFAKCRGATIPTGVGNDAFTVVGFAKGAGMIEPHLATMLVYVLTDLDLPKATLNTMLRAAVATSFNAISVDSDESTSDTVVAVSSRKVAATPDALASFEGALKQLCAGLADDVVRNGEGTNHVLSVAVSGAPSDALALQLGRAVVNSPLLKCAVNGNDPNVGRLVAAVGKFVGDHLAEFQAAAPPPTPAEAATPKAPGDAGSLLSGCTMRMGGRVIFEAGQFKLSGEAEQLLVQHMKAAELGEAGQALFPRHKRRVEVELHLGNLGEGKATVLGSDLSHEYVNVNADYRS